MKMKDTTQPSFLFLEFVIIGIYENGWSLTIIKTLNNQNYYNHIEVGLRF